MKTLNNLTTAELLRHFRNGHTGTMLINLMLASGLCTWVINIISLINLY